MSREHGRASDTNLPADLDRIVREQERRKVTGLGRTAWHVLERRGLTPTKVQLTDRATGWLLSDLLNWVRERKRASEAA